MKDTYMILKNETYGVVLEFWDFVKVEVVRFYEFRSESILILLPNLLQN